MRKSVIGTIALAIVVVVGTGLIAEEGKLWLDPANCHFCQPLTQTEGLMEAVGWENHNIANGIVSITTYAPEWEEASKAAGAEMMKRWGSYDPAAGQNLCGMCEAWTAIPMDKLKMEKIEFKGGEMSLTTTDDAELLAKLHAMTDKTTAAMAEFMKMEAPTGHEGHGH